MVRHDGKLSWHTTKLQLLVVWYDTAFLFKVWGSMINGILWLSFINLAIMRKRDLFGGGDISDPSTGCKRDLQIGNQVGSISITWDLKPWGFYWWQPYNQNIFRHLAPKMDDASAVFTSAVAFWSVGWCPPKKVDLRKFCSMNNKNTL